MNSLISTVFDDLVVLLRKFFFQLLVVEGVLHREAIVFKLVLGVNFFPELLIFVFKLFTFMNHLFDFFFRKATSIVSDCNFL